jgi:hypothetical protein
MLPEEDIQHALHARRVVPLSVTNPHGPLGLEQLTAAVARIADSPVTLPENARICRPISLSVQTWEKLEQLAQTTAQTSSRPETASEVATAIIEQFASRDRLGGRHPLTVANLFSNLHRWLHRQGENFVTEVFAFLLTRLLAVEGMLGKELVTWLCCAGKCRAEVEAALNREVVEVSVRDTVTEGQPDIWLTSPSFLALVEVKKWSPLGKGQLERYREILNRHSQPFRRLVLLTELPVEFAPDGERPDSWRRWYCVAEWLRTQTFPDPVAAFLAQQFIEFLEQQGMAVQPLSREYLVGVQQFLRLITLLEKALGDAGLTFDRSFQRHRFGFYLKKPTPKAFLIYIDYATPALLRFQFFVASFDKAKVQAAGGSVVDGTAFFAFNLDTHQPDFFTLPGQEQLDLLTTFLKDSYAKATKCLLGT